MSEIDENLWGELPAEAQVETPSLILKQQAAVLTRLTKGVLEGQVVTGRQGDTFYHELCIVAPTLANYSATVLTIQHDVTLYPVEVISFLENRPGAQITQGVIYWPSLGDVRAKAKDAADLRRSIGNILQSERIRKLISALLAQARDESPVQAARVAEE